MPNFSPALRGDGHGNYRIHLTGNSGMSVLHEFSMLSGLDRVFLGTGKSTLGAYLSAKLNLPHISLDEIAWKPGWQRTQDAEFREKVCALMAQDTRGWIVDGDYRALGTLVPDTATDIIWLDPPLRRYLPRLLWRTCMRLLGLRSSCAEGCADTWEEVFSSKGIVWFCATNHGTARTKYAAWLTRMNVAAGGKMVRLDESRGELARWKDDLETHLQQTWFT